MKKYLLFAVIMLPLLLAACSDNKNDMPAAPETNQLLKLPYHDFQVFQEIPVLKWDYSGEDGSLIISLQDVVNAQAYVEVSYISSTDEGEVLNTNLFFAGIANKLVSLKLKAANIENIKVFTIKNSPEDAELPFLPNQEFIPITAKWEIVGDDLVFYPEGLQLSGFYFVSASSGESNFMVFADSHYNWKVKIPGFGKSEVKNITIYELPDLRENLKD